MLRVDRICLWIIIIAFALIIPSISHIGLLDEVLTALFASLAFVDCIFNNNWRKYRLFLITIAIFTFYAIYSIKFLNYNTTTAILWDMGIELKPFITFSVVLAISPSITPVDKKILKAIALFNATICTLAVMMGGGMIDLIFFHPTYLGIVCFVSAMFYLFCALDSDYRISKIARWIVVFILTVGIASTRSKYYGLYVLCIFFIFFYRPGFINYKSFKHMFALVTLGALVIIVAWSKIQYYFISGAETLFDPQMTSSFARPVLYLTGWMILWDHFPFGTGLASFASFPSAESYSMVYYEYGINNVHGLSERFNAFICDAYYPSLAQYGFVGLILFIWFWVYAYNFLRTLIRIDGHRFRYPFIIGSLIIIFFLIESIAATTLSQSTGMPALCLLAITCGIGKALRQSRSKQKSNTVQLQKIKI